MQSLSIGQKQAVYTGVIVHSGQDTEGRNIDYSVGDNSGSVLEVNVPNGSYSLAYSLLAKLKLRGYQYQPFESDRTIVDPAVEIGDNVTVDNVPSIVMGIQTNHSRMMVATLKAQFDEEINHEFKYEPRQERTFRREMGEVRATLSIQAGEIAAKVSATGGDNQSFGWSMTTAGMFWYANGSEIMRATKDGLKVTGEIVATSGNIGGATIVNGVLTVENANIGSINGSKIADYSIGQYKYGQGSIYGGSGGAIASGTVSYGNVGFTGTLDQVGVNKSNIEALQRGYFGALACTSLVIGDWQIVIESGGRVYAVRA